MFPEPTELLLIGYSIESIWTTKIQIKYIDTKNQLSDILTKGNVTRDEWNNLLHFSNISHFSSTSWAKGSSLISCTKTMAKRMQEQKEEERSVTKSKSTATNLSSHVPTCSSSAKSLLASKKSGNTHSYGETLKQDEKKFKVRRSVGFSSATAKCIPWRVDGHGHGETCRYKRGLRIYVQFRHAQPHPDQAHQRHSNKH